MCGRFALFSDINSIVKYSNFINLSSQSQLDTIREWTPNYNISPSAIVPVIIGNKEAPALSFIKWGLVPDFAGSSDQKPLHIINAKSETIDAKSVFKNAFGNRRCLVPANGFYEWRSADKQPFFISLKDHPIMFFGGIWNRANHNSPQNDTFAIITTGANHSLESIHHRMPVIINRENIPDWLYEENTDRVKAIISEQHDEELSIQKASKEVNNVRNNHSMLLESIEN